MSEQMKFSCPNCDSEKITMEKRPGAGFSVRIAIILGSHTPLDLGSTHSRTNRPFLTVSQYLRRYWLRDLCIMLQVFWMDWINRRKYGIQRLLKINISIQNWKRKEQL